MRVAKVSCFGLLLLALSWPVAACSWGNPGRRLQEEIHSYYDADAVFLARLEVPRSVPPGGAYRFSMLASDYELIEAFRGDPPLRGVVATEDTSKPGLDGVPPDSCTGWLLHPGMKGTAVIFARKGDEAFPYLIGAQSIPFDGVQEASRDLLQRLRLYRKFEEGAVTVARKEDE